MEALPFLADTRFSVTREALEELVVMAFLEVAVALRERVVV